jgi:hypothetical protein
MYKQHIFHRMLYTNVEVHHMCWVTKAQPEKHPWSLPSKAGFDANSSKSAFSFESTGMSTGITA